MARIGADKFPAHTRSHGKEIKWQIGRAIGGILLQQVGERCSGIGEFSCSQEAFRQRQPVVAVVTLYGDCVLKLLHRVWTAPLSHKIAAFGKKPPCLCALLCPLGSGQESVDNENPGNGDKHQTECPHERAGRD